MNATMFPPRGSSVANPGGPSPPASIARSSVGTGLYAQSESGRSRNDEQFEATLSEHYVALKRFLAASLRDEKGNPRPNRARDKLLRLSPIQFQELSTDVYDELMRRQASSRRPPSGNGSDGGPPPYLLPKDAFHPKRNQARQKLSTLPSPRFRDLATDVFYELERRFPRFAGGDIARMGSPTSIRGPPSRMGTPADGMRGPSRVRRPSDASSIAYSVRSESRGRNGPLINGGGSIPPSPGIPPNEFGRPTPKTFQSNTIVPNKSTMVEDDETGGEDNDDDDGDAFGLESAARNRERKKSSGSSETDKKLIEDYQSQVRELREKLDAMEDTLKQKDDELTNALDAERNRESTATAEKREWSDLRLELENKLADAQNLTESLQSELNRVRDSHADTEKDLQAQIEELRESGSRGFSQGDLELENDELRNELREQRQVTDEVRREAQEFLREMRMLSEQTTTSFDREEQYTKTINKLEDEVRDWRNRYARTKTQLRSLRAGSMGLTILPEAAKYTKDSGFTEENGLVKDVHVTKYQISIDELLQMARADDPARVIEFMKAVVVNVRRITQDIDDAPQANGDLATQRAKLKSRVSATANNLITASKNFALANGLSPVSLLDAAASHLTAAVVELVRTVKIRPTPAGELEDDDDGNLEPVDPTGFFSVKGNGQPPFLGLPNGRISADSSMYSPVNSPRESTNLRRSLAKESWAGRQRSLSRGANLANGYTNGYTNGVDKSLPPPPIGEYAPATQEGNMYLEDQTALLVQNIQSLVSSIRSEAGYPTVAGQITAIANVVGQVVAATENSTAFTGNAALKSQGVLTKLSNCRERLIEAGETGRAIAEDGNRDEAGEKAWRVWNQSLPPIAFEIARDTKELVTKIDSIHADQERGDDDFS
ncbi:hypothetical protein OIDMADRAFT_203196 [Oidiodendron maius Zn]|uniref:GIT Spa2 homology (SHD) domain-containing protein n=1 Tax=Oidiodendron maius (strain Zn) TaxID=913774 RepID=A0A0C3CG03_OIDMZ|nr:hypothetical protein OIDMADRAFT_203196 [Oidiodendron maius Zn]